jgi:cytochrome c oxidase assembly protein subunit 15
LPALAAAIAEATVSATAAPLAVPKPDSDQAAGDRPIALWLLVCCAMILAMVVIGGITRLTESGLSITEWRPISGVIPPLNEVDWQHAFSLYQQIPEYQELNRTMTLAEFKGIYWWEFTHRMWGRLIGVVFAVPFAWFLLRGRIRRPLIPRLATMLVLGGLQGGLGWYMVQSGLAQRTDVSQYRLAAHLLLALAIYGYILWTALSLLRPQPAGTSAAARLRPHLWGLGGLLAATLALGAFVAGLNGGMVYNSFPLMGGQFLPTDAVALQPLWRNLFENPVGAQFAHRWLAMTTVVVALALWARGRRLPLPRAVTRPIGHVAGMALIQAGLGLATLLLVVPIPLAAAHQAGAVLLLSFVVWALVETRARGTT